MVAAPNVATGTLPIFSPDVPPKKRKRKGWAPDDTDHVVYQWVVFEGKSQSWAAAALGLSQPTISRILQRYEKWQAHATPATDGRLSHAERQRAQRWLTYQRNEIIIARSLRMAGEMEGFNDVSKSVLSRPVGDPAAERQVRTEHMVVDRSAIALRFLRLAHRINMDQQKLVDQEPLADLPPLSPEEVAEQVADAAAVALEQEALQQKTQAYRQEAEKRSFESRVAGAAAAEVDRRMGAILSDIGEQADALQEQAAELPIRPSNQPATLELNLHNLHNRIAPPADASAESAETYDKNQPPEIPAEDACIGASGPQSPDQRSG